MKICTCFTQDFKLKSVHCEISLFGSQEILFFVVLFIVQLCCLRGSQAFSFLSVNGGELDLPPEALVQEVFLCGGMKINGNSSFSHFQHSK